MRAGTTGPGATDQLNRTAVFAALTRPQMFAGVTYTFFVLNAIVTMELFLLSKAFWPILAALVIHAIGYLACLREPRIFDLWLVRVSRCPRVPNFGFWRCNSYAP